MAWHFDLFKAILAHLAHKACPPAHVMMWLDLQFDTKHMTVIIPNEMLRDMLLLVEEWSRKTKADICEFSSFLCWLFHMMQYSHPARLFVNPMLATLRCFISGHKPLSHEFHKYINWFKPYLRWTNGVYIIDEDHREPIHMFLDACASGAIALLSVRGIQCPVFTQRTEGVTPYLQPRSTQCCSSSQKVGIAAERQVGDPAQ